MRKILMIALNTVVLMGMASMSFAASSLDAAALGYTCLAAALGIGINKAYEIVNDGTGQVE